MPYKPMTMMMNAIQTHDNGVMIPYDKYNGCSVQMINIMEVLIMLAYLVLVGVS